MIRRGLLLLGVLAGLALTGCQTTDWEGQYNDTHVLLLEATQERDEALMREEALRQEVAHLTQQYREAVGRQADPAELTSMRQRLQEATTRMQQAEEQAAKAASVARDHAAQAERYRQQVAQLESERNSIGNEFQALQAEVDRLIAQGKDAYVTKDGNIEIRLPSDVTFASGEATLTRSGQSSVRSLRDTLNGEYAAYKIRLEGHTDSQPLKRTKPKWGDNFGLASARALSVLRFMENDMKIEPSRLESAARGEYAPVVPGAKSKTELAKNRRVNVIVVIPRADALAMAK